MCDNSNAPADVSACEILCLSSGNLSLKMLIRNRVRMRESVCFFWAKKKKLTLQRVPTNKCICQTQIQFHLLIIALNLSSKTDARCRECENQIQFTLLSMVLFYIYILNAGIILMLLCNPQAYILSEFCIRKLDAKVFWMKAQKHTQSTFETLVDDAAGGRATATPLY